MEMKYNNLAFPADRIGRLSDFATDYTGSFSDSSEAEKELEKGIKKLSIIQDKLYADNHHALLIILQALDAAGKDSTIKHVMSGINPQGCRVTSFKAPSTEELDHDYLWRCMKLIPAKGEIGIFNRSYYEEVLIVRVHPEILDNQKLSHLQNGMVPDETFWQQRYSDINNFEKYLSNNDIHILKFFLHVSKDEQKKRFLKRIDKPEKNWKLSDRDVAERKYWDDYQYAYEQALIHTSTKIAPWYVIPADHKWFMQLAVCNIIVDYLESLDLNYPQLNDSQKEALERGKLMLLNEK
jgi:PPK2 family polyphosphate:nucleotide phosphotransferase